jgi:hypothetical protein
MSFATDMRGVADSLITDLGNSATFKNKTSDVYDPTTGKTTTATADKAVTVAGPFGVDPKLVDGDLIQARDAIITLSAEGITTWSPDVGEKVVIDSKTWVIVEIKTHRTQDTTIAWEMRIR